MRASTDEEGLPPRRAADRGDLTARILADLPEAVLRVNADGSLALNRCAAELFGLPHGEVSGAAWTDAIGFASPEDSTPAPSPVARLIDGESFDDLILEVRSAEGSTWVGSFRGRLLRGPDGDLTAAILTVRDVTEAHRGARELRHQEQQLRILLEALPVGVWLADAEGKLVYNNPAGREIWGASPHVGMAEYGDYKAWRTDTGERLRAEDWAMHRAISRGETVLGEVLDIEAFDGTLKTIMHSALPVQDPQGRLLGGVVINVDITERRAAERETQRVREALEASLAQLEAVFAHVEEGLGFAEPSGNVVKWNEAGARLLGYAPDDDLSQVSFNNCFEVFTLDGRPVPREARPLSRALAGETFRDCEYRLRRTDTGLDRILSASGTCVRDAAGEVKLALVSLRDITEAKRIEQELRESVAEQAARVTEFQTLMDAVPAIVFVAHDPLAQHITGNRACYELLRLPPGSNVSRSAPERAAAGFRVCRNGVELAPEELPLQRTVASGEPLWGFEEEVVFADGVRRYVYGNAVPLVDDAGRTRGAVAAFVDITERKEAEDGLRLNAERFRVGLSHAPVAIFNQDMALRYTWGHTALPGLDFEARFSGLRDTDALERKEEAEALEAFKRNVLEQAQGARGEFCVHIDGVRRYFDLAVEPWRDEHGRVCGLTGAAVDITGRKGLEASLRKHTEALAEADRRKDEFLAMLAHELRNPLTPIHHAVHYLARTANGAEGRQWPVEVIGRQVDHLIRLVDDLLDVARITRGRMSLQKRTVRLGEVVPQAVETVEPMLEQRGQGFFVEVPEEPLAVHGDPVRLVQVLGNLLHNASKYTPEGGEVHLILRREGDEAVIRVRDTGIGIRNDLLPAVFDLFRQADASLARTEGGLGLGLALVNSLVRMHGGGIAAYSDGEGRGSEFVVRLPLLAPRP